MFFLALVELSDNTAIGEQAFTRLTILNDDDLEDDEMDPDSRATKQLEFISTLLEGVPFDEENAINFAASFEPVHFEAGEVIVNEGDDFHQIFGKTDVVLIGCRIREDIMRKRRFTMTTKNKEENSEGTPAVAPACFASFLWTFFFFGRPRNRSLSSLLIVSPRVDENAHFGLFTE